MVKAPVESVCPLPFQERSIGSFAMTKTFDGEKPAGTVTLPLIFAAAISVWFTPLTG
ncbi:hypothetical protein D3C73_1402960 [compost metagenome]